MPNVAQGVIDLLDTGAVLRDREIPLDKRMKLIVKKNSTCLFVVLEQIAHGGPEGARSLILSGGEVEDVFGDGALNPAFDRIVRLRPEVVGGIGGGAVDVGEKTELAAHGGEE